MFKNTFEPLNVLHDTMDKDMDKVFSSISGDVTITNNNGHIVIVGKVKSLRINDKAIELMQEEME